jgi:hypothetical protein
MPDQRQQQTRQKNGGQKSLEAEPRGRRGNQHDERAGRAADLKTAAAERRDQKASDDRSIEPALRRHAGGHRDRHRERQRDDGDGQCRSEVAAERLSAIALGEGGDELGAVEMCGCGAVRHGGPSN